MNKLQELLSVNALIHWLRWIAGFEVLTCAQYWMGVDEAVDESTSYALVYMHADGTHTFDTQIKLPALPLIPKYNKGGLW